MKFNGLSNKLLDFFPRLSSGNTTWEVGHVSPITRFTFLDHHRVLHKTAFFRRLACLSTLFSVLGGMSMLGLPAMLTVPGLFA